MSKNLMIKLSVDLSMTILMVLAMAYHFTGDLWHEIIGVLLFILFFIHNFLNRRWYIAILRGRYNLHRALNTTTNLFLVVIFIVLGITGILHSRHLFPYATYGDDLLIRRIHTASAYCGYLLIGIHLGIHWSLVLGGFRKMAKITGPNRVRTVILRIAVAAIALWGIKASFDRDIGLQLISYFTFSFWDSSQSVILYLLGFVCIMGLYAAVAYYTLKLLKRKDRDKQ